ncbi:SecY-interacting protein [Aliiglaciecola sp. CAU 1673]|uniref:SecY-interacting protein n=1 Tax=Aliiglaciecola sp. CAU 1673 TaxID=3032595 RepID=UPI0023D991BC|nr:SecY-interacting protein [Aliiglaciecola sp. CAU 1673]MDF2179639.1 SecY-interacting protein [Aliiglaciecola sp. CAU 1673]
MNQQLCATLDAFVDKYMAWHQAQEIALCTDWDPDWPSSCKQSEPNGEGVIHWQPVRNTNTLDFSSTEQALGITFHPDLKTFYSRYWSEGLNASTDRGRLQLLQLWNEQDFERLLQNLVGHVLMKRRLKQPITVFIAVTDNEDYVISLDNDSGQVVLERVGLPAQEVLADNLSAFIDSLNVEATLD